MKLFVGLGNPGPEYERNRHNVGFMVLDKIADDCNVLNWKRKFQGLTADVKLDGERVILLKPQTYMNESGRSVGEAARFLKIATEDVIVFHDEIDLPPAKLKVKTGGGNAGHNGLKSISAHIGNDYTRVRIGVGRPGNRAQVSNHVLNDFAKSDAVWLEPLLEEISNSAARLASSTPARFLNDIAKALAPEPDPTEKPKTKPGSKANTGKQTNLDTDSKPGNVAAVGGAVANKSGERDAKRKSALAENLQKWLKGTGKS